MVDSESPRPLKLMICNVPNKCDEQDIADAIDSVGCAATYDTVHFPYHVGKAHANYVFVNFKSEGAAHAFVSAFEGFVFAGLANKCTVRVARVQGECKSRKRHHSKRSHGSSVYQ